MHVTPVRAVSSALDPNDLIELVGRRYLALGAVRRLVFLKRWISDTYRIEASAGPAILRVYRAGWRTRPQVDSELAALQRLAAAGVPVSVAVADRDLEVVQRLAAPEGERLAVVFTFAPGQSLYHTDLPRSECAGRFGEILGAVHATFAALPPEEFACRPRLDVEEVLLRPVRALAPYLEHRPRDLEAVTREARHLADEIERRAARQALSAIHGDVDPGNVHFDAGGEPMLFDFDFFGPGYAAYDVAVPLWEFDWAKWPADVADRWLEGYRSRQPTPGPMMELVRTLMPVRGLWYLGLLAENAAGWGAGPLLSDRALDAHLEVFRRWLAKV